MTRIPESVARVGARRVQDRERALLDNLRLARYLEEDVWLPNTEPTASAIIDATERRGFSVELLVEGERGEHIERFWGVYSHRRSLVLVIHEDHTGVAIIPTDEKP